MYRSLVSKVGVTLKRATTIINGESSSSSSLLAAPAKYFLFRIQNKYVFEISNSRVTSTFSSFSTANTSNVNITDSSDSSSFVVSYLINSCGLSETEAINASEKLNFKTKTKPDSVLKLLKSYGFTETQISNVISKVPSVLQSNNPTETLKPKLDFYISKGISEIELPNFILRFPGLLTLSLNRQIIPSFDTLRSIVPSDESLIKMIERNPWILSADQVKRVMDNVELLRNQGVPETDISLYLIKGPRTFNVDADRFKEIVAKVKEMGIDPTQTAFPWALHVLRVMPEASLRNKMEFYKRLGGWSEDQVLSAFRDSPTCMKTTETRIKAVLSLLVNEVGYDSSTVAENPIIFNCNLKKRIIPRCSVIRVLVSRGLIKENISLGTLATLVNESFLEKFVKKYEQEVPGLMKVFEGQLNYQELLQN